MSPSSTSLTTTRPNQRSTCWLGRVLLAAFLLLCSACSSPGGWKKIGLKDMQTILPRMLLTEALYDQRGLPDSIRVLGYQTLLGEYGYNLSDWDSSLVWYGRYRIPEYQKLYESATGILTAQQEKLQQRVDSLTRIATRERMWQSAQLDSVNLLPDSVSVHPLGRYLERSFALTPDGTYGAGTEVRLAVRLAGLPRQARGGSLRLQLQLLYTDSTAQTVELKALHQGLNSLSFVIPAGKQMRQALGVLRGTTPRGRGKWLAVDSFSFARFPSSGGMTSPAEEGSFSSVDATEVPEFTEVD